MTKNDAVSWLASKFEKSSGPVHASKIHIRQSLWWLDVPLSEIEEPKSIELYLLCQIKQDAKEFHCLKVPIKFLKDELRNLDVSKEIGRVRLHLSAKSEQMFVEQRGKGRINFSRFLMGNIGKPPLEFLSDEPCEPRERRKTFKNCAPPNKLPDVEENVAIAIAKVAYFISPKVVKRIAELNRQWRNECERNFGTMVRIDHYFYEGSACVFPGVRRRAYKEERQLKLKKYHHSVSTIFDDNVFPRHLWCFLCAGKPYSRPLWNTSGLREFELAHVLPHKTYEHSGVKDWFMKMPDAEPFHGLFSCAANVILLPKGMAKPTDGTAGIRAAVINRYFNLHGSIHSGGFGGFSLPDRITWFDKLQWNDPVEPEDWERRIENLDAYRRKKFSNLLK